MTKKEFEKIVTDIGLSPVPEKFRNKIKNVVFVIEDEPSGVIKKEEGLKEDETLLGLYHGIPHTERGENYGVGVTLPDTITLYKKPIEEEAKGDLKRMREVIAETIWHEVAHHFGLNDSEIHDHPASRNR
ncbi:MAG: metallopeptidase family protein [bacterium]|nr:metallopeptidase family protein [bacterium]